MQFESLNLYHLYSRGNNKQKIFFSRKNCLFFLEKSRKYILPYADVLCYCLMPNHFHFLIHTKSDLIKKEFSNSIRILLSSYATAIQFQEKLVGSLFQQNCKAKLISTVSSSDKMEINEHPFVCFN